MKLVGAKLLLVSFGLVVATLTSPALAQTQHYHRSPQRNMTADPDPVGQGIYDVAPGYGTFSDRYDPANVGGGSFGYNQSLHDNKW